MYDDKSWGSADDYSAAAAAGKTAVGVVTEVLDDGSVKIMNLKDLTFSSLTAVGNFDPDNPYGGSVAYTYHTTSAKYSEDVTGIPNYNSSALLNAAKTGGIINISFTASTAGGGGTAAGDVYDTQYNELLNQYDMLVNDSSYKGINLLKNDTLDVRFNEDGSSRARVAGKDVSSTAIGLTLAAWAEKEGIQKSINELQQAISTLRSFASELGGSYSIVTTRQDFTENLINVLEEGADKLTLADMNEESANMLALQTRQQLAITALSLASEADRSVLKLF